MKIHGNPKAALCFRLWKEQYHMWYGYHDIEAMSKFWGSQPMVRFIDGTSGFSAISTNTCTLYTVQQGQTLSSSEISSPRTSKPKIFHMRKFAFLTIWCVASSLMLIQISPTLNEHVWKELALPQLHQDAWNLAYSPTWTENPQWDPKA